MPRLARELFASTLVVAWTREARHVQPNFGENPLCRSATDAVIYIQFYCHINSRFHCLEKPPFSEVFMLVSCVFCRSVARYQQFAVVSFKDVRDDCNRRAANDPYWSSCTRFCQRLAEMGRGA